MMNLLSLTNLWILLLSTLFSNGGNEEDDDPGLDFLKKLKLFENKLDVAVNLKVNKMCNCSRPFCDPDTKDILGLDGICRSISGTCFKRLLRDNTIIHACLEADSIPELFCSARQPMIDGSVMACCHNYSFCNAELELNLPPSTNGFVIPPVFLIFAFIFLLIFLVLLAVCLLVAMKRPLKFCFAKWRFHFHSFKHESGSQLLLSPTLEQIGHLGELLSNLDDSATTGSGAGLPLLVQRTIARQIKLKSEIGRGRYGEVWLGYWKDDPVAVKIFNTREERSWKREVEIFETSLLRHPNIVRFIASDNKDTGTLTQLWLITEYHENGSVFDYISVNVLSMRIVLEMIRSIATGLSFLHTEITGTHRKPAIAHRDLKTKNILIKSDLTCAIADLGLSVRFLNGVINLPDNNKCGTLRYLSPEVLMESYQLGHFESYKMSDMYSIGLVIWEIMTRCDFHPEPHELPYTDCVGRSPSVEEMRNIVCLQNRRPKIHNEWAESEVMNDLSRIMQECWAGTPSSRLTAMNVRKAIDRLLSSPEIIEKKGA